MNRDPALAIADRGRVLTSPAAVVGAFLGGPSAIAAWFPGVSRDGSSRTVAVATSPGPKPRRLLFKVIEEEWDARSGVLTVQARCGELEVVGHLTLRRAVTERDERLVAGTEVWVCLETMDNRRGRRLLTRLTPVIERGLQHLHAELDT